MATVMTKTQDNEIAAMMAMTAMAMTMAKTAMATTKNSQCQQSCWQRQR